MTERTPGNSCADGRSRSESTPSSTLVLGPHRHERSCDLCGELLTTDEEIDENVLFVTFDDDVADKTWYWNEHVQTAPRELAVIDVDVLTRSTDTATAADLDRQQLPQTPTVRTVSDPADITELGHAVTDQLSEWDARDDRIVVCFQSLTTLLCYIELPQLFRFLHVLLHRLESAAVVSHFHLDPSTVSEQELGTLEPLFDTVVSCDDQT